MLFTRVAQALIEEVPVTKLQRVFFDPPVAPDPSVFKGGGWCGLGCRGSDGDWCGFFCDVENMGMNVIDPEGRLGLTAADLQSIRENLPILRKEVTQQLILNIENFRGQLAKS